MAVTDQPGAAGGADLHGIAVDVQSGLQKLATGLAHAGANPVAVAQLTKMADVIAQVIKVLGEGPPLDQNSAAQQAGHQPPAAQGAPQGALPPPPGPSAPPQQHSLHAATHALHAAMQASAQSRAQGQPQP